MKIVISGAGAIGFHLAELLSKENQDITLIDRDLDVLRQADRHLDVLTVHGDVSSLEVLRQANVGDAKLFIAVTTSEATNILTSVLAKKMGAKRTIARISDVDKLHDENRQFFEKIGVDVLISPQQLAAQEIKRLIERATFTDLFEFENGKISIVGFTLDTSSPIINKTIEQVDNLDEEWKFRGVALLREHKTLIPKGSTLLQKGDHLYLSAKRESIERVKKFVGRQLKDIRRVMIVGGSSLTLITAKELEKEYSVTVVLEDEDQAKYFVSQLHRSLVVVADPCDVDALKEEGLEQMDAFIALTPNFESNIVTSLMAEEMGVYKTIALVENVNYTHISQNIGIDTIINKKLIAANSIFRFVRKGKVEAIAGLHGVSAEIIEFVVHKTNRLLNHPIKNLHFPDKSIIAGVVRGDQSFVPEGDSFLELGDKVIVLALPEAIHKLEKIFK
ncbi:MAG TPA: Trk system potassium transporter TrkA [Saprospiraceae bacterium]|nr:Trk system potassium transporter TrkA [Saprospiraceae bacterium]